jgi:hypothetical protein
VQRQPLKVLSGPLSHCLTQELCFKTAIAQATSLVSTGGRSKGSSNTTAALQCTAVVH